ncbi:uncharacterized protein B0P05DRAFT_489412 [Gilbertella persicaria]|uniref:uncharacterized protein n=1 Tax=Gilbertella persicaria TaxID=101096 RepID=UPI0022212549|nr:uncharacterized protein B0P05DRAFT_489412 [Gilbertella persicaria]KAI8082608.1 hypothetical protein B0P05DRAFT_489412 [Gilbertella persicaria]
MSSVVVDDIYIFSVFLPYYLLVICKILDVQMRGLSNKKRCYLTAIKKRGKQIIRLNTSTLFDVSIN